MKRQLDVYRPGEEALSPQRIEFFNALPVETVVHVLENLEVAEWVHLARVSPYMRDIVVTHLIGRVRELTLDWHPFCWENNRSQRPSISHPDIPLLARTTRLTRLTLIGPQLWDMNLDEILPLAPLLEELTVLTTVPLNVHDGLPTDTYRPVRYLSSYHLAFVPKLRVLRYGMPTRLTWDVVAKAPTLQVLDLAPARSLMHQILSDTDIPWEPYFSSIEGSVYKTPPEMLDLSQLRVVRTGFLLERDANLAEQFPHATELFITKRTSTITPLPAGLRTLELLIDVNIDLDGIALPQNLHTLYLHSVWGGMNNDASQLRLVRSIPPSVRALKVPVEMLLALRDAGWAAQRAQLTELLLDGDHVALRDLNGEMGQPEWYMKPPAFPSVQTLGAMSRNAPFFTREFAGRVAPSVKRVVAMPRALDNEDLGRPEAAPMLRELILVPSFVGNMSRWKSVRTALDVWHLHVTTNGIPTSLRPVPRRQSARFLPTIRASGLFSTIFEKIAVINRETKHDPVLNALYALPYVPEAHRVEHLLRLIYRGTLGGQNLAESADALSHLRQHHNALKATIPDIASAADQALRLALETTCSYLCVTREMGTMDPLVNAIKLAPYCPALRRLVLESVGIDRFLTHHASEKSTLSQVRELTLRVTRTAPLMDSAFDFAQFPGVTRFRCDANLVLRNMAQVKRHLTSLVLWDSVLHTNAIEVRDALMGAASLENLELNFSSDHMDRHAIAEKQQDPALIELLGIAATLPRLQRLTLGARTNGGRTFLSPVLLNVPLAPTLTFLRIAGFDVNPGTALVQQAGPAGAPALHTLVLHGSMMREWSGPSERALSAVRVLHLENLVMGLTGVALAGLAVQLPGLTHLRLAGSLRDTMLLPGLATLPLEHVRIESANGTLSPEITAQLLQLRDTLRVLEVHMSTPLFTAEHNVPWSELRALETLVLPAANSFGVPYVYRNLPYFAKRIPV